MVPFDRLDRCTPLAVLNIHRITTALVSGAGISAAVVEDVRETLGML